MTSPEIHEVCHRLRVEALARLLCAHKEGLLDDILGQHLADFQWRVFQERADAHLFLAEGLTR